MPYFRTKPTIIEARCVRQSMIASVAKWCQGLVTPNGIAVSTAPGVRLAIYGDWIIDHGDVDYEIMGDHVFKNTYEITTPSGEGVEGGADTLADADNVADSGNKQMTTLAVALCSVAVDFNVQLRTLLGTVEGAYHDVKTREKQPMKLKEEMS